MTFEEAKALLTEDSHALIQVLADVARLAPGTEVPEVVPEGEGDLASSGSEMPTDDAGAELIDSFDDTELNYEREPETDPQTGFDL